MTVLLFDGVVADIQLDNERKMIGTKWFQVSITRDVYVSAVKQVIYGETHERAKRVPAAMIAKAVLNIGKPQLGDKILVEY